MPATALEQNLLLLVTERTTYAPGDRIWVNVTLQRPSNPPPYSGSVALFGDERTTLLNGQTQSVAIFPPITVDLEPNAEGTWRVSLSLPQDIPPSCDLGAIPPSGLVLYVLTAKMTKSATLDQSTCTRRIKVVSTPQMANAKEAEAVGMLLDKRQSVLMRLLSLLSSCIVPPERTEDPGQRLGSEDMAFVRETCHATRLALAKVDTTSDGVEFRVTVPHKTSIRCGEHLTYRVEIRGSGPSGRSLDKQFARIKAVRVWIRRTRMFSDGTGQDNELQDVAKQPQWIDFVGGQGGVLPVGFDSQISIPLGMAPTVRGSLVTNEYDLIVEVLSLRNQVIGALEVPITVWRDVEGNLSGPAFSPTLRSTKAAEQLNNIVLPMLQESTEERSGAAPTEAAAEATTAAPIAQQAPEPETPREETHLAAAGSSTTTVAEPSSSTTALALS